LDVNKTHQDTGKTERDVTQDEENILKNKDIEQQREKKRNSC
jgi:hypothetical protein